MEAVYSGRFLKVVQRDGWEYVTRGNITVVGIVAIHFAKLILVEQFRKPINRNIIEIPAGLCGDKGVEHQIDVARRELIEETGFEAGEMKHVGAPCPASAGLTDEAMQLFFANQLKRVSSGGGLASEGENIIVHEVPLVNIWEWISEKELEGTAVDARVYAAIAIAHKNM